MIKKENSINSTTNNFEKHVAPEVNQKNFSYECDIYSLVCVFLHIMYPDTPFDQRSKDFSKSNEYKDIKEIIMKSMKEESKERPSILEMIFKFCISYYKDIQINNLFEIYMINFTEYYRSDKNEDNKTNQNVLKVQFYLGYLYSKGELIPRDMNKSIRYYSLTANQNHVKAQFNLGVLYSEGELIPRDMNKSIHYFSLAANQNDADAQFKLQEI